MVVPNPEPDVALERRAQRSFDRVYTSIIAFWITYLTLLFFGGALEAIKNATDSWWAVAAYWTNNLVVMSFLTHRLVINGPFVRTKRAKNMDKVNADLALNSLIALPLLLLYGTAARELASLIARTTTVN